MALRSRCHQKVAWMCGVMVLAGALMWSSTALAAVAHYWDLHMLVDRSQVIVHATVVEQQSRWDDRHNLVSTRTTFQTRQSFFDLSGSTPPRLEVEQFGGTADGITTTVEGSATFTPGQEVVLFLNRDAEDAATHYLVAMAQSSYTVRSVGGHTTVQRDLNGLVFYIEGVEEKMAPIDEAPQPRETFFELLEQMVQRKRHKAAAPGTGEHMP